MMNTLLLSACIIILAAAVIATNIATRREGKFLKERTDDLLLRTHHLENPEKPKKFMTSAGEISINVEINKEAFDEQIDKITEDLDAVYNEAMETLKMVREIRAELEPGTKFYRDGEVYWPDQRENKKEITRKLYGILRLCDFTEGITWLDYFEQDGDEYVVVEYRNGQKRIDVTADSGFALLKDVIKGIEGADYYE